MVLGKFLSVEGGYGFLLEILTGGWRQKNSFGYGEESLRHLSLFAFGDL